MVFDPARSLSSVAQITNGGIVGLAVDLYAVVAVPSTHPAPYLVVERGKANGTIAQQADFPSGA